LIKLICHFKRKAGLTLEDAKFDWFPQGADGEPDYDVITESWYRREDLEKMAVMRARPEIDGLIVADEEEFMDRSGDAADAVRGVWHAGWSRGLSPPSGGRRRLAIVRARNRDLDRLADGSSDMDRM
jgi:hypothetical protein